MWIRITREAMLQALRQTGKAVSAHPVIPLLTGLHISVQAEEVRLTASNMAMTIEVSIQNDPQSDLAVGQTGALVVPAKILQNIIQRLDPGWLTMESDDHNRIVITSGHSRFRLQGVDPGSFPIIPSIRDSGSTSFDVPAVPFRAAIRQVLIATSASETRSVFTGVSATFRDHSLELMATDGVQLAHRVIPLSGRVSSESIVIPSKTLSELYKLIGEEDERIHIEANAKSILFRNGRLQLLSALLEGSMPVMTKLVPASFQTEIRLKSEALLRAVERVSVLANSSIIRLTLENDRLKLFSKTAEIGEVVDEVELQYAHGEHFAIALNGLFLTEIIRCIGTEHVSLQLTGSRCPVVIIPIQEPRDALFILTPVLTSQYENKPA
ncbi:DNA polymerase III subunit beta [Paenibacillus paeoniae]|uniref:Beta sliding clamp n=1 Tax=Paenibacillus paeoniae TaxID=2292705 RepID=A0A371PMY0_9BACL|nr:DNA polymerase III subunit beta [Paenibacillus paeoniae]REK77157.1 DNA polymerase III subunit beta [Paenibacillus paeoniae]